MTLAPKTINKRIQRGWPLILASTLPIVERYRAPGPKTTKTADIVAYRKAYKAEKRAKAKAARICVHCFSDPSSPGCRLPRV